MHKTVKKIIVVGAALGMLAAVCLPGARLSAAAQDDAAMGRYLEEDVTLPEGITEIFDIKVLTDGTVKALARDGEGGIFMSSSDNGVTWETGGAVPAELFDGGYLSSAALSGDGSAFIEAEPNDGTIHMRYFHCSPQGEITEVKPAFLGEEDLLLDIEYLEPGKVIGTHLTDVQLYLFEEKTGEVIRTYNENENAGTIWDAAAGKVYLFDYNGELHVFDGESAEESTDEVLRDAVMENPQNIQKISSSTRPMSLFESRDGEEIFFCCLGGLYRHTENGAVVERVIDGALTSLGNPSIEIMRMEQTADGAFLLLAADASAGATKLMRYAYSPDTPTVPDKEVKVYALRGSDIISQGIAIFQKQNPDYYVSLEIGMSGDDAVTEADAIRTLNTAVLAGSGPDVLILDGLPMDSYIEKGMLTDLTETLAGVRQTDGLFENIADVYTRDGALYALPSGVKIPMIQADASVAPQLGTLTALADTASALREENPDVLFITETDNNYWFMQRLYQAYSPNFIRDGAINEEAVAEFVNAVKQIYALDTETAEEFRYNSTLRASLADPYLSDSIREFMYNYLMGNSLIGIGTLDNLVTNMIVNSLDAQHGTAHDVLRLTEGSVFVPQTIMGISSKSEDMQSAQEFVKFFLSKPVQMNIFDMEGQGFSVNRAAFEQTAADCMAEMAVDSDNMSWFFGSGVENMQSFTVDDPTEEEMKKLGEQIASLDTPSLTDEVVHMLILEQTESCMTDQISADEAVRSIVQKLNLYLAE